MPVRLGRFEMPKRLTKDESTATDTYAKFIAEPFETGYGHTIGNSIRRVLLSSLEGAAITSIKIDGAMHEFATVDGVVEDVTERRLVQDQLAQAQRMEAVGQLTGGLAHDFNNLLHIIIGNLDLLALDVSDNASAAEKVEAILGSSLRGAELTAQLLAFSRRQALAPRPLRLNRLLQHARQA